MSNREDGKPLDEVFQEAEQKTEREKKLEKQKREIKEKLTNKVADLQEGGDISDESAQTVREEIRHENFDKAREELTEALKGINFEDEEKQLFADKFSEEYQRLQSDIETMKNSLLDLEQKTEKEDIVAYLFGKHSDLRKTDIRKTIEGISNLTDKSFTTNDMAQIISGFESDLNKSDAEDVIEKIKEEA